MKSTIIARGINVSQSLREYISDRIDIALGHVQDSIHFIKCNRILKILNYLLPVSPEVFNEIPPLSILREFIGGNTLYMKDATSQLMADWPADLA